MTKRKTPLPPPKVDARRLGEMRKFYEELIGFVPPRIQARTEVGSRVDPDGLELQEEARAHFMYPKCFDVKTSQLMLFGILLGLMGDAGRLHALAARRAGATWEELWAVAGFAYLFRGLPAANLGADIIQQLAAEERKG
jgi:alkylhydroperoxidase/carboxymuconolactone decarboxylase family protein YurZ